MIPLPYAKVIVNPIAGGCSSREKWPRINQRLHNLGLLFDHEFTRGVGHATEIARQAIDSGYHYVIAVGGDGTVNEVVNGILNSSDSANTIFGIVNCGTACSVAYNLGITRDYLSACSILTGKRRALIDVGVVRCWKQGQPVGRFFINVADVGFAAAIVDSWGNLPSRIGLKTSYALRTAKGLGCLFAHRNKLIKIRVGNTVDTFRGCAVVVANGQYFAERMRIAPHAKLDDGLLDVVIVGDMNRLELLRVWPTLYNGSHITHPKIKEEKATEISVESEEQLLVEADGETVGESPASFSVMPSALTVLL